jgi:fluoroquinolone resistance protein
MDPFGAETEFFEKTFDSIDLHGATVAGKEFHDCVFSGIRSGESALSKCRFISCSFKKCDLSNLTVKGSTFRDVAFEECKLLGVNWTTAATVSHLNFFRCVLNYSNFIGLDLRKSIFKECVAREMELAHANLSETDCQGTDFAGTKFLHTNLSKADFRRASNYAIRPDDNILKQAKFSLPEATALLFGLDIFLDD